LKTKREQSLFFSFIQLLTNINLKIIIMSEKELERLKQSLKENIDDTNYWVEHAPTEQDWHFHIGYRSALKEVLQVLNSVGVL
jgi:hypothetical protein